MIWRNLLVAMAVALPLLLFSTIIDPPPPFLVWNVSPSAPLGLYRIDRSRAPALDDFAAAALPLPLAALAAERGYLPSGVPLVKRVAARPFDRVCAQGPDIIINNRWVAARLRADTKRRPLPWWDGCRLLREGELFLLADDRPDAFDGRYTGVTPAGDLIGKADLIWPR